MKKTAICMICERRYHDLEEAELCERRHEADRKAHLAKAVIFVHEVLSNAASFTGRPK
jgi:hypothetical protein